MRALSYSLYASFAYRVIGLSVLTNPEAAAGRESLVTNVRRPDHRSGHILLSRRLRRGWDRAAHEPVRSDRSSEQHAVVEDPAPGLPQEPRKLHPVLALLTGTTAERVEASSSLGISQAAAERANRKWALGLPALCISLILVWVACFMDESKARFFKTIRLVMPIYLSFTMLRVRTMCLVEEERRKRFNEFHVVWAEVPLQIVLQLQGFYIKVAQITSALPEVVAAPYAEKLAILQENVPAKPFPVIERIIQAELNTNSIWGVFRSFEHIPVGSASIGQVHMAELLDGTKVAVKVQYPEAEHFFRLDLRMLRWMAGAVNPDLDPILERIEANFIGEFDYRREGANLRKMCNSPLGSSFMSNSSLVPACVGGTNSGSQPPSSVGRILFPEPFDGFHRKVKQARRGSREATILVTRRLLVMERCPGASLAKLSKLMLASLARQAGKTVEEMKLEVQKRSEEALNCPDAAKLQAIMAKQPTARQMALYRKYAKVRRGAQNAAISLFNLTSTVRGASPLEYMTTPVVGPQILDRIYAAIGYSLFELGLCNPDPHAGNILYDEATDTLSLIDYGQLITVDQDFREAFAQIVVAVVNKDKDSCYEAYLGAGCANLPQKRGAMLDEKEFTFALLRAYLDGIAGLLYFMELVQAKNVREVLDMMVAKKNMPFVKQSPPFAMVIRCMHCLKGVGSMIGCWGSSQAEILYAPATAYLMRRKLPLSRSSSSGRKA